MPSQEVTELYTYASKSASCCIKGLKARSEVILWEVCKVVGC